MGAVAASAGNATLIFTLEGENYEVPALCMEGNEYMLYLPEGEWYPSDFEGWGTRIDVIADTFAAE